MKRNLIHHHRITTTRYAYFHPIQQILNTHCNFHRVHTLMPTSPINPSNGDDAANQATLDCVNSNRRKIFQLVNEAIKERDIETIYHYTSSAGLESILRNRTIRFTRWNFLNDTSEYLHIHDIIKRCLIKLEAPDDFKRIIDERNTFLKESKNDDVFYCADNEVFIASFSKSPDNLALWQGYSKSARTDGYCIGFDYHNLFQGQKLDIMLAPVIYKDEEKENMITTFLRALYNIYNAMSTNPNLKHDLDYIIRHTFDEPITYLGCLLKHHAFEHEDELRAALIHRKGGVYEPLTVKIRNSNGLFVSFLELPFEHNDVKSVTASPTLDKRPAVAGLDALKKSLNYNFLSLASQTPYRVL